MLTKLIGAMFLPKYPRGYTGRHRADFARFRGTKAAASATTIASHRATA